MGSSNYDINDFSKMSLEKMGNENNYEIGDDENDMANELNDDIDININTGKQKVKA